MNTFFSLNHKIKIGYATATKQTGRFYYWMNFELSNYSHIKSNYDYVNIIE